MIKLSELLKKEKFTIEGLQGTFEVVGQDNFFTVCRIVGNSRNLNFPSVWMVTQVDEEVEFTRAERNDFARQQVIDNLSDLFDDTQPILAGSLPDSEEVVRVTKIQNRINQLEN